MAKNRRLELLEAELQLLNEDISTKQNKASILSKKIEELRPKQPTVSDHAIVRYMERELDLDIQALKNTILTDELIAQMKTLGGNGKFKSGKLTIVIQNYLIKTIY